MLVRPFLATPAKLSGYPAKLEQAGMYRQFN